MDATRRFETVVFLPPHDAAIIVPPAMNITSNDEMLVILILVNSVMGMGLFF